MFSARRRCVRDPKSSGDNTNLQYISKGNPHLTSWFGEYELDLNLLFNMISQSNLARFVGPIGI